ncbi:MAG: EFR1 family ferrodoxin [Anaerolineae bacterium]|nr:EFR1 family ferrodoxin [Anaerolineae bacterium]
MVRGVLYYYSGSGNTRLACQYLAKKIQSVEFDLVDILAEKALDAGLYDVIGLAAFTDFLGPPYRFKTFVAGLPDVAGKAAFVFNTYGLMSGKTLPGMKKLAEARGLRVVNGHSLHTPENYPPNVAHGPAMDQAPDPNEMALFEDFIAELDEQLPKAVADPSMSGFKIRLSLLETLIPKIPRTYARRDMGAKFVDAALCIGCGSCAKGCPYGAIKMANVVAPQTALPIFDEKLCYGCWRCFNRCPKKAIYTRKFRGEGHYPAPNEFLRQKLRE